MPTPHADILEDIRNALVADGSFAEVGLGASRDSASVPRATVELEDLQQRLADDLPGGRMVTLRATIRIAARGESGAGATRRLAELCEAAISAVLADPTRGGRCEDLPTGPATGVVGIRRNPRIAPPNRELLLELACNYAEEACE